MRNLSLAVTAFLGVVLTNCATRTVPAPQPVVQERQCVLEVHSEVDGVNVYVSAHKAPASASAKTWVSRNQPAAHRFLLPCVDHQIRLTKRCYPDRTKTLRFSRDEKASLLLKAEDWLHYGYLRVRHPGADPADLEVRAANHPAVVLKPGSHAGIPFPLGKPANVTFSSDYKIPIDKEFTFCKEEEVVQIEVSTSPDRIGIGSMVRQIDPIVLEHGKARLFVLTELKNVTFQVEAQDGRDADVDDVSFLAPEALTLDSGVYRIVQGDQCVYVNIDNGQQVVLSLPGFNSDAPLTRDCKMPRR